MTLQDSSATLGRTFLSPCCAVGAASTKYLRSFSLVLSSAMMTCDKVILNSLKGQKFTKSYRFANCESNTRIEIEQSIYRKTIQILMRKI